jgi:hypothetical protein
MRDDLTLPHLGVALRIRVVECFLGQHSIEVASDIGDFPVRVPFREPYILVVVAPS